MKTTALTALISMTLATSALADGPSLQETRDYIFARCNDSYNPNGPHDHGRRYYVSVSAAPHLFTFTEKRLKSSKVGWVDLLEEYTIDLRETNIQHASNEIFFSCGNRCISITTRHIGASGNVLMKHNLQPRTYPVEKAVLTCRETPSSFNAFKHLQERAGGRKKDPFAN